MTPMPFIKDTHCSYCGSRFPPELPWPRHCPTCGHVTYRNPLPVSVVLLPVDDGVLLVRRTQEPQAGKLSLPGGFIELGESWQEAGARELWEETGIRIQAGGIRHFATLSAPDGTLLVFGLAPPQRAADLPPFVPMAEVSETVIAPGPLELAFSTHAEAIYRYFGERTTHEQADA